jgi:prevent-host-death family protein
MHISITEAESRLDEPVDRAEAGDEVILTCNGRPVVQLVPIEKKPDQPPRLLGQDDVPKL